VFIFCILIGVFGCVLWGVCFVLCVGVGWVWVRFLFGVGICFLDLWSLAVVLCALSFGFMVFYVFELVIFVCCVVGFVVFG